MPKVKSDLLQSFEEVGEEQELELSTRGRSKGGVSTPQPWLFSLGPSPAWEGGSQ